MIAQTGTGPAMSHDMSHMSPANRGQFRTATAGKVVWTEQMREIATSAVPCTQASPGPFGVSDRNRAQGMVREPLNHQSVELSFWIFFWVMNGVVRHGKTSEETQDQAIAAGRTALFESNAY